MDVNVLGVKFSNTTMDEAVNDALQIIARREKSYIVTPNPEIVMLCRENTLLAEAVDGAVLTLPDGVGITIGAKILGTPLKARIPGIDFTDTLIARLASQNGRIFLLGAKKGVAESAAENLVKKYPGLVVTGCHDGYFTDDSAVIDTVNAAPPDLLLVCLGATKQELWMARHYKQLDTAVSIGLGGVIDTFAGNAKRAPLFMRKLGLEWLYRLAREPWRIKRMVKLPLFVFAVLRQKITRL